MAKPVVSCLVVTENRPAFMPWVLWCYDRQCWSERELVIVDSSSRPYRNRREDVRVIDAEPGTGIAGKRNIALRQAQGDIVTWFDDDDWQHPRKLEWLVTALEGEAVCAGPGQSWFVELQSGRCRRYNHGGGTVLFNGAGFRREAASSVLFPENVKKASDTRWMRKLRVKFRDGVKSLNGITSFFWLCHERNISNPARLRNFPRSIDDVKADVGAEAWGETDEVLDDLRRRLERGEQSKSREAAGCRYTGGASRIQAGESGNRDETGGSRPGSRRQDNTDVGVMIKATTLDAPYLDVMVRHMIAQARHPFAERLIVVDKPASFTGKYRFRPRGAHQLFDRTLNSLLRDGVVDRVLETDPDRGKVGETMHRYFSEGAERVPTHATTGGPIYATLYGLEAFDCDYILQLDADIFFHASGDSWVGQALELIKADPDLWLMMAHPGPPAGPAGASLGERNAARARWDADRRLWKFRHATTRYFLCDRRRLRGCLKPVLRSGGCRPLEECISRALQQNGAFRGALGGPDSWHLHAWFHGDPFPEWAPALARAIEAGRYPAVQRGRYDLRLDKAEYRRTWAPLIGIDSDRDHRPAVTVNVSTTDKRSVPRSDQDNYATQDRPSLSVVIPVRDRDITMVRNALRGLNWQSTGPPAEVIIVSHGSRPEVNASLGRLCIEQNATLLAAGSPASAWNKSLALNMGIRASSGSARYLMTMDSDMILAPEFFTVLMHQLQRSESTFVLCRIADLPRHVSVPGDCDALYRSFPELYAKTTLRGRHGSGGIQAAARSFFFDVRGYDEDLEWWGAMDGDMVRRARRAGLRIEWIEDRTSMLHQWHPRKHAILNDTRQINQAKSAWRRNHDLSRSRAGCIVRNDDDWGAVTSEAESTGYVNTIAD